MKEIKQEKEVAASTEEKFKEAARTVFTKKGYAATKTRDIAEEAGLNLALLNYYFRSKEKLFEIIMAENVQKLFAFLAPVLNDGSTALEEKIEIIAARYIEMLFANPDLPLFVLSEIREHPQRFAQSLQIDTVVFKSSFMQQLAAKSKGVNPVQFLLSLMGMLIFPFIAKPVFQTSEMFSSEMFDKLIEERKRLVPQWLKIMLE